MSTTLCHVYHTMPCSPRYAFSATLRHVSHTMPCPPRYSLSSLPGYSLSTTLCPVPVNHAIPCPLQPGPDTTSRLVLSTTSRLVLSAPSRQFLSTTQYRPCPQCYAMSTMLCPVHHIIPCPSQYSLFNTTWSRHK